MRPKKLVLQAFGPFLEQIEVDFQAFENQGLFLISGPTGSGKTTIFNAICYALYDKKADGSDDKNIKSDFASGHDRCFVLFEFEHQGHYYSLYRQPKQKKYNKNQRLVQVDKQVQIEKDGQLIPDLKIRAANQYIEKLLGLTMDQFSQIVLLPQGQFEKFLVSNSREKEEIFRSIFKTHLLQDFQNKLNEQVSLLEHDYKRLIDQMGHALAYLEVEEEETDLKKALEEKNRPAIIEMLQHSMKAKENQIQVKDQNLNESQRRKKELGEYIKQLKQYQSLMEEKEKLDKQVADIEQINIELNQHKQASELEKKEEKLAQAQLKFKQLDDQVRLDQQALDGLINEEQIMKKNFCQLDRSFQNLDKDRSQLDQLKQDAEEKKKDIFRQKELKDSQQDEQTMKKEMNQLDQQIISKQEEKVQLQSKLKAVDQAKDQLVRLEKSKQEISEKQNSIKQIQDQVLRLKQLVDENKQLAKQLEGEKKKEKQYGQSYHQAQAQFHLNMAAVLADELQQDQACPVCGSTDHPCKAQASQSNISQAKLDQLQSNFQDQKLKVKQMESQGQQKEDQIRLILNQLDLKLDQLEGQCIQLVEKHEDLIKDKKKISQTSQELEEKIAQKEEWEAEQNQVEQAMDALQDKKAGLQALRDENKKTIRVLVKEIERSKQQGQPTASLEQIEEDIASLSDTIEQTEQAYDALRDQMKDKQAAINQLESTIELKENYLQQQEKEWHSLQTDFSQALEKSQLDKTYRLFLLEDEQLENKEKQVQEFKDRQLIHKNHLASLEINAEDKLAPASRLAVLQADMNQIQQHIENTYEELKELNYSYKNRQKVLDDIKQNYEESQQLDQEYSIYYDLASTALGQAEETAKVSFERYVMGMYLDDILVGANQLLDELTDQQFQLLRLEESENLQGAKGLDISVYDHYSQSIRPAKALSGGEKFKASLSLAIALSQVIQEQSAASQMGALFIDEGFGSLDRQSVEKALHALLSINRKGRMIGIISHVQSLKEFIPNQIHIKKTSEGSHLKQQS